MKLSIFAVLMFLASSAAMASNPYWLEGMTAQSHEITVYRNASCGCCKGWIEHLKEHNFEVTDVTVDDVDSFKRQFNVPPQAASCHTAMVDGLVVEGHVPAQDIKAALTGDGDVRILTVPAMPSGTPGMDFPGAPSNDFHVYSIDDDGQAAVFNSYSNY